MDENLLEVASTVPFSSKLHLNIFRVEKLELKNIRLKKFERYCISPRYSGQDNTDTASALDTVDKRIQILHQPSIQWTR